MADNFVKKFCIKYCNLFQKSVIYYTFRTLLTINLNYFLFYIIKMQLEDVAIIQCIYQLIKKNYLVTKLLFYCKRELSIHIFCEQSYQTV